MRWMLRNLFGLSPSRGDNENITLMGKSNPSAIRRNDGITHPWGLSNNTLRTNQNRE
jgi:hypothetical protein